MPAFPASSAPVRRVFLLGAALVVAMISCGREVTAPSASRFARGISFSSQFPGPLQQVSGGAASVVPFTKVRVLLDHSNGFIALDTVIGFPAGSDQLTLAFTVQLLHGSPANGELMTLNLAYINTAGDTVFRGGPVTVLVVPSAAGQPAPVQVPLTYSGAGSTAKSVRISPKALSVAAGDIFTFTAAALDANGVAIPNTPIVWTTLDPSVATLASAAAGVGTARTVRGTAQIQAQLLTGPADVATLTVLPKASTIVAVSGTGQSGAGGAVLPLPVIVKVTATDGLPMAGVPVVFAATSGGAVGAPSVTTDASGLAQATWTLGPSVGAQSLTATAVGISGSPVTFGATSTSGLATRLVVATQPANGVIGAALAAIVITAQDAGGNVSSSFSGPVTVALAANPGGATLGGAKTVSASAGVAIFSTLTIDKAATGYTLVGSASGLTPATTSPFNVTVPQAALLGLVSGGGQTAPAFSTLPAPIVVQVVDAAGIDMKDAGRVVSFAATTGGGSVAPASAITDALGRASVAWTLGSATGLQTMTASSTGLTEIVVRATATASVGQRFTWLGTVDTSWTNPANWSPAGVPGGSDAAFITNAPRRPSITVPASLSSLAVGVCQGMGLTSTLTISGNLADSSNACLRAPQASRMNTVGMTTGIGTVILTGDGTLMGDLSGDLLITGGTRTMINGNVYVGGSTTVSGTAKLDVNGKQLYIGGSFATTGGGTLKMTSVNGNVQVAGGASFAGGSETGLLTAGVLTIFGDITQAGSPTAFAPSGTHETYVGAPFSTQKITFANPTTSFFQDLDVGNSATLTLQSNVTVNGTLTNAGGVNDTFTSSSGYLMTVAGLSILPGATIGFNNVRLKYVDGVLGAKSLDNVAFYGFAPGATFLEFSRTSGGPYNFNSLSFVGTLNASGRYVINTGTVPLTLTTPFPNSTAAASLCGCVAWFTAGAGGITWP